MKNTKSFLFKAWLSPVVEVKVKGPTEERDVATEVSKLPQISLVRADTNA